MSIINSYLNHRFCIVLAISFQPSIEAYSQSSLSGIIKDNLSNPLPYANVFLKSNGVISKLTFSDELGKYKILTIDTGLYELNVSAIGYKRYFQNINLKTSQTISIDIFLISDTLILDQVIISSESAIKTKGDTIIYNAEYFLTGDETVLEDLLKKLPGVNVLENGKVQFQGKDIKKIKIENDDLFNTNYTLLTKNLSADLVEQVEILQDYSDNGLLRGLENSDDVAINLTFKENRKNKLFGDVKLGGNFKERYEGKVNLISFIEKIKIYGLSNFNSTGDDPTGDVEELINPNQNTGKIIGDGTGSEDIVRILKPSIQEFKRDRYIFNQSKFGSLSGIFKPLKNMSINITSYLYNDKLPFLLTNKSKYFTPNDTILYNEATKSQNDESIKYLRGITNYSISENANMSYRYVFSVSNRLEDQEYLFNLMPVLKALEMKTSIHDHHINFTNRISQKSAFTINLRYLNDLRPQSLFIDGNVLNNFFTDFAPSDTLYQQSNLNTTFWGAEGNLFANIGNRKLGIRVGLSQTVQTILSNAISTSTMLSENVLRRYQKESHIEAYYMFRIKRLSVTPSVSLQYIDVELTDRDNDNPFFINPKLGFKWQPLNESTLTGLATLNSYISSTSQLTKNPIVTNYNSVSINDSSFRDFAQRTLLVSYLYGGWGKGFSLNSTFFYQKALDAYLPNIDVESNYILTTTNNVADRKIASFSITADKYFKSISSNVKISLNSNQASFVSLLEGISANTKSSTNRVEISFRSAFIGNINFHIGHIFNVASSYSNFIDANNYGSQYYFDIYLKGFSKKLNATIHFERLDLISVDTRPVFNFLDINVKYQIPKSRFALYAKAKNLFNEEVYKQRTVSNQSTSITSNQLIPRYILIGLNIRL